jgi:outer membrane protein TolC
MIVPQQGRRIADPHDLAPPRQQPPGSSLPKPADAPPVGMDLNSTITTVLERSPTLERVLSRIRQAEYQVGEAYTMAQPTVTFNTQYSRVEPGVSIPGIGQISPSDNYQFSLTIRQAIYTFGRLKWTALAAELQQRVTEEEYRTEVNRLVQLTAQRYIEALLSQDAVKIAQDNLEAQQANLRTSQLLYEQGVAARFDVLSNSAAVARAEQRLIEARTAETNAKARVLSLLDEPLDRSLRLQALELHAPLEIPLADAKDRALESRPDLRSGRWAVEEAKARVEVAETSNNPTLELQNTSINRNGAGFNPGTQNTTAIVLSVPLYDGGVSHYQAEEAKEAVTQLSKDLEQNERDVVLQVEEIYNQLHDRWLAISVAEENVRQADEALRVAVLRYQNGISTNTELLEAQANRSQARFDLAQTRANYLQSRWTWWQATASEYPTEVPFPADIRERLDREGLPMRPATQEFSDQPSGQPLGPFLPPEEAPRLPIRGLPTAPVEGPETPSTTPASGVTVPDLRLPQSSPGTDVTLPPPTQAPSIRPSVPSTPTVTPSSYPGDTTVQPVPSVQPGRQPTHTP